LANLVEIEIERSRRATAIPVLHPKARLDRTARDDGRWVELCAALNTLRQQRRCAVRIVDADCGCGALLIAAVRHASALGFTAIEGRGVACSPALIGRARSAAARLRDPSIGLSFEVADPVEALANEVVFPADILLWHERRRADQRSDMHALLNAAAGIVIRDRAGACAKAIAA
jgi:hypothetical protein